MFVIYPWNLIKIHKFSTEEKYFITSWRKDNRWEKKVNSYNSLQIRPTFWKPNENSEYNFANGYFLGISREKTFADSQISVFQIIIYCKNVRNSQKVQKILPFTSQDVKQKMVTSKWLK